LIKKILIYNSGGGIGDSIQILPLISTLKSELKTSEFYYLTAHENHFNSNLKDYNCKIYNIDLNIKYFGFRWWHSLIIKKAIKKNNTQFFDLIIDLQSKMRNSLILKMIPHKYFLSSCFNFKLCKPSLNIEKDKKTNNTIIKGVNLLLNKNISLKEFDVNTINKELFIESEKLLPENNYVGFSITQGNVYRKKEWPLKNIVEISSMLIKNKKIPVFFIEKKEKDLANKIKNLIPKALIPEHESKFSSPALVTCLGKRLDFAISIDNGIMHMLSLSKVPMISLFGPTDSEKFAPNYEKSIVLDSKKIYNTKNISAITVADVLTAAKQFVNF
tara:strand:- start:2079 stop:3068 length:990 start_codon:yes stop_codon:yes gene_type:complete